MSFRIQDTLAGRPIYNANRLYGIPVPTSSSGIANGDVLSYNATTDEWEYKAVPSLQGDVVVDSLSATGFVSTEEYYGTSISITGPASFTNVHVTEYVSAQSFFANALSITGPTSFTNVTVGSLSATGHLSGTSLNITGPTSFTNVTVGSLSATGHLSGTSLNITGPAAVSTFTTGSITATGPVDVQGNLRVPRVTTAERDAASYLDASIIFNTTDSRLQGQQYAATGAPGWVNMGVDRFVDLKDTNVTTLTSNDGFAIEYSSTGAVGGATGAFVERTKLWPSLYNSMSSGLLHGGQVSFTPGGTVFTVAAGSGIVVNNTNPSGPVFTPVEWPQMTGVRDPGSIDTVVGIDMNGALIKQTELPDQTASRQNIFLTRLAHQSGLITNQAYIPQVAYDVPMFAKDMASALGSINVKGNVYSSAVNGDLRIQKTQGELFHVGGNYGTDTYIPNISVQNSFRQLPAPTYTIFLGQVDNSGAEATGSSTPSTTGVDPTQYNNTAAGTLVTLTGTQSSIQRIFLFGADSGESITAVMYGQTIYADYDTALAAVASDPFIASPNLEGASLRGYLVIRNDVTNLDTDPNVTFITASKLGEISGGPSSTTGGVDLQTTYDASVSKSITTTTTGMGVATPGTGLFARTTGSDANHALSILDTGSVERGFITGGGATTVTSLNAGSGTIQTTGNLQGGAGTVTSLNAGSGTIQTTGNLQGGATTVSSLNAGSGTIQTTGLVSSITLDVGAGDFTIAGDGSFQAAGNDFRVNNAGTLNIGQGGPNRITLNAANGDVTSVGALNVTGTANVGALNAGSGTIQTTGNLQGGTTNVGNLTASTTNVSSLNSGGGTIQTTGTVQAGTLNVTGDSTIGRYARLLNGGDGGSVAFPFTAQGSISRGDVVSTYGGSIPFDTICRVIRSTSSSEREVVGVAQNSVSSGQTVWISTSGVFHGTFQRNFFGSQASPGVMLEASDSGRIGYNLADDNSAFISLSFTNANASSTYPIWFTWRRATLKDA